MPPPPSVSTSLQEPNVDTRKTLYHDNILHSRSNSLGHCIHEFSRRGFGPWKKGMLGLTTCLLSQQIHKVHITCLISFLMGGHKPHTWAKTIWNSISTYWELDERLHQSQWRQCIINCVQKSSICCHFLMAHAQGT